MSQYDFDNFHFDGEWDDAGEIAWSEAEWQRYLGDAEKEVARFISVYNSVLERPDRLDETAHIMGWDRAEWALGEEEEANETSDADCEAFDSDAPYTIHRHPVYIASTAIYLHIRKNWGQFLSSVESKKEPSFLWQFASSLRDGEMHAILGVQCLDLGDNHLAVCHFKQAHTALNETLQMINRLSDIYLELLSLPKYQDDLRKRLLDLREIWLRVIQECRR